MARARKCDGLEIGWKTQGAYPIHFIDGLFEEGNAAVADVLRQVTGAQTPRVLLVADLNVVQRTDGLGTRIGRYVQAHGVTLAGAPVVMGGGEKIKSDNLQSVMRVVMAALEARLGASDVILAIGGGSLLDVAGYAASQLRGGVKLVRVPTTVAAMVDAAYAETAAVNLSGEKDALAVASRPAAVIVDVAFARTVLDGVWCGGLGEVIRHAAVTDATLLKKLAKAVPELRARDLTALGTLVREAVAARVKKGATPFALWAAHRLEEMSGFKLPHGYAVPIAVSIEAEYALATGLLTAEDRGLIGDVLASCGATEGLTHSQHLLSQAESILSGLDAWRLRTDAQPLVVLSGPGKAAEVAEPDRAVYQTAIKTLLKLSTGS